MVVRKVAWSNASSAQHWGGVGFITDIHLPQLAGMKLAAGGSQLQRLDAAMRHCGIFLAETPPVVQGEGQSPGHHTTVARAGACI